MPYMTHRVNARFGAAAFAAWRPDEFSRGFQPPVRCERQFRRVATVESSRRYPTRGLCSMFRGLKPTAKFMLPLSRRRKGSSGREFVLWRRTDRRQEYYRKAVRKFVVRRFTVAERPSEFSRGFQPTVGCRRWSLRDRVIDKRWRRQ